MLKRIASPIYRCSECGELFKTEKAWEEHYRPSHQCPICKHSYLVYGCELECSRQNNEKRCRFETK